ncbi:MAG: reverse transcriptase/maturase family protein [bacterium]|nr:reverse transcriptase/maturase family protein [bacterium]
MRRKCFFHTYEDIISVENLLDAWGEFIRGKRGRKDVQEFSLCLMDNIFSLHRDLATLTYRHGPYQGFRINDPKPRSIHKATVRDRLLHRAVYRILYPFFDRTFIADSYSCRLGKGTHEALNRFRAFAYKVGRNNTRTCWVLKCDIRKFFANIHHKTLYSVLEQYISDTRVLWLIHQIVGSFSSCPGKGLPLGNLTSQLLVNIYMNEFDQFVKHELKARYYVRYADDFVLFLDDAESLRQAQGVMSLFLRERLRLEFHPDKVFMKTLASGVDFLGWAHFPRHRVLRTTTKRRMFRRLRESPYSETLSSYASLLLHGNAYTLRKQILFLV